MNDEQDPRGARSREAYDDEISLVDLWLVLHRRRKVILVIFGLVLLAGVAYALMERMGPTEHEYMSIIEIGNDRDGEPIEARAQLATRLRESTWPNLVQELRAERGESADFHIPGVQVSTPDEETPGDFVYLRSSVLEEDAERVDEVHQAMIQTVLERHGEKLGTEIAQFQAEIEDERLNLETLEDDRQSRQQKLEHALEAAESELDELKDQQERRGEQLEHAVAQAEADLAKAKEAHTRLRSRLARLEERREFLLAQREELRTIYDEVRRFEIGNLESFADDSTLGMGMLLRGNLTSDLQKELTRVREELELGLDEQREKLEGRVEDAGRAIEAARQALAEKRTELAQFDEKARRARRAAERKVETESLRLDNFENDFARDLQRKRNDIQAMEAEAEEFVATEVTAEAVSLGPEGGRRGSLIVALSAVLGGMLGVFGAFFAEFNQRAREAMDES